MGLFSGAAHANDTGKNAFDFSFNAITGEAKPLAAYKGKALLVVNTASLCGFTRQYEGLQALHEEYADKGLVVLGVPSNDFGGQEPKSNNEIKEFCAVNFNITFPMTEKVSVKGASAHPFYQWAKASFGSKAEPSWNFHKLLINRDGEIVDYFSAATSPTASSLKKAVEGVLVSN